MAKQLLTLVTILLLSLTLHAQNTIKGVIYDNANGEAVPFANVMLDGTRLGAATDINGFFLLNKIPDGKYKLVVRFVGYSDHEQEVELKNHATMTLNIKLSPTSQIMKAVEVTTKRSAERKIETQVSVEKLSASQIQQMPSIGGQADLAQYMQVLPGVNSTGDQGGQLYIRGGSMIQNLCLLDGMTVYNPFHSIGLYSIFETDVILNADIYTGGFGAEYGGRLSSVMDINTRDGNKKRHTGKIGLNTFGSSIILEGPLRKEKKSPATVTYLLNAKNSFLSKSSTAIYPYIDGGLPFDFLDLYGKVSFNSGLGSKLNLFGFRYDDQVIGYKQLADYHWRNSGLGGNFVLSTGTSSMLDGTVAYSDYNISLDDNSGQPKSSSIAGFNANMNITNFYGKNKLKVGFNVEGYKTRYRFTNPYGISQRQDENTTQLSFYATYHLVSDKWLVDPGFRLVYYASLNEVSPEPRLALKYNATDKLRFKFAGGLYSQILLDARSDNDISNLFSGFLTGSGLLGLPNTYRGDDVVNCIQKAQHLVLGVEYDLLDHLTGNMEFYLKNFGQLINMNHNQMYDQNDPAYMAGGVYEKPSYYLTDFIIEKGLATGVDFSLCYDLERLYLWATYSLGYVSRTDEVQTYNPHYDRRHTINMLATYYLGDQRQWEFSGRWAFGSGYPFTQTLGIYENILFGDGIGSSYWNDNGNIGIFYGDIYGGRLPTYHRLDLGVKRKFSIGSRSILELNLSVTNVYNRNNIFYYDRLTSARVDQLPILLCGGLSLKF